MVKKVILVTNDDGIDAEGLKQLANVMKDLGQVLVVAPTIQRSGESKSLTLKRPLRPTKIDRFTEFLAYSLDGTPADSVIMGRYLARKLFGRIPDLVVSGINSGDNTSVHALLTSGTVAASIESALIGIPSIAFSLEVPTSELFTGNGVNSDYRLAALRAKEIAQQVLKRSLPEQIRFLNVNFPASVAKDTAIEIVGLSPEKYTNEIIEDKDPRGSDIYWIWGGNVQELEPKTDAYVIYKKRSIAITPITLSFGHWSVAVLQDWFSNRS